MNRSLRIKRLYSLGNFKNIAIEDYIDELPQEIAFNEDLISKIRFLQMINVEIAYDTYVELNKKLMNINPEEQMAFLEDVRVQTLNEIKGLMNGDLEK